MWGRKGRGYLRLLGKPVGRGGRGGFFIPLLLLLPWSSEGPQCRGQKYIFYRDLDVTRTINSDLFIDAGWNSSRLISERDISDSRSASLAGLRLPSFADGLSNDDGGGVCIRGIGRKVGLRLTFLRMAIEHRDGTGITVLIRVV